MFVTTRLTLGLIQNNPGITIKAVAEALDDFPIDRAVRLAEMLSRNRLVEVEGVGVLATVTSRFPDETAAVQAARNAGIDVDVHV